MAEKVCIFTGICEGNKHCCILEPSSKNAKTNAPFGKQIWLPSRNSTKENFSEIEKLREKERRK